MQPESSLETFVEQLLAEKQFHDLEPEVRDQLKSDLISRAEDHINAALLKELSETDLATFESMLEQDKDAATLQAFLASHIQDMNQVVAAALLAFRNSYIGS